MYRRDSAGGRRGGLGSLGGYTPGDSVLAHTRSAGTLLPGNSILTFQMHYTPFGRAVTDHSRIGIYLHDAPPRYEARVAILANTRIRIPAETASYSASAARTFDEAVRIYSLLPHAHYRGIKSRFEAIFPDGRTEVLLSVPNYDFNWQTNYVLREPKYLPAGTTVVITFWWDNSSRNPANPDSSVDVIWGLQSWDEMLVGWITYSEVE